MTPDEQQWYKEYVEYHNNPLAVSRMVRDIILLYIVHVVPGAIIYMYT